MASSSSSSPKSWLGLSQAAKYLGVHFTTLRRWADSGEIACLRTPGGKRRFSTEDLDAFLERRLQPALSVALAPLETRALDATRHQLAAQAELPQGWLTRSETEDREYFRHSGRRLLGLILRFSAHPDELALLDEGQRLGTEHGIHCSRMGLTIGQTMEAFLFFRRTCLSAIHESVPSDGMTYAQGHVTFERVSGFLDNVLLATTESYHQHSAFPPASSC